MSQTETTSSGIEEETVDDIENGWKPYTMKPIFLGILFSYVIVVIVLIEVMLGKQRKEGALLFARSSDGEFTQSPIFIFHQYMISVLSIGYGIFFAMLDLDVKRLEPYYILSKPNGAYASVSLLLTYPADYLPFVPITAARNGHWLVFLTGFSTLTMFWGTTPFLSALLNGEIVQKLVPTNFSLSQGNPYDDIGFNADTHPLNSTWITTTQLRFDHENLPFTTDVYAVRPFKITFNGTIVDGEKWIAPSTVYFNDIRCFPATVSAISENDIVPPGSNPDQSNATHFGPYRISAPEFDCVMAHYFTPDSTQFVFNSTSTTTNQPYYYGGYTGPYINETCGDSPYDYFTSSLIQPSTGSNGGSVNGPPFETSNVMCREVLRIAKATVVIEAGTPGRILQISSLSDERRMFGAFVNRIDLNTRQFRELTLDFGRTPTEESNNTYEEYFALPTFEPYDWFPHVSATFSQNITGIIHGDPLAAFYLLGLDPDIRNWMDSQTLADISVVFAYGLGISLGSLFIGKPVVSQSNISLQSRPAVLSSLPRVATSDYSTSAPNSFHLDDFLLNQEAISLNSNVTIAQDDTAVLYYANQTQSARLPAWIAPGIFFLPFDIPQKESVQTVSTITRGYEVALSCDKKEPEMVDGPTWNPGKKSWSFFLPGASNTSKGDFTFCVSDPFLTSLNEGEYSGAEAYPNMRYAEVVKEGADSTYTNQDIQRDNACRSLFAMMIIRNARPNETSEVYTGVNETTTLCKPTMTDCEYSITVDISGQVLDYNRTPKPCGSAFNGSSLFSGPISADDFLATYRRQHALTYTEAQSHALSWPGIAWWYWTNAVIRQIEGEDTALELFRPSDTLPTIDTINNALNDTYRTLFPIFMGLNYQTMFEPANNSNNTISGSIKFAEQRYFVDNTMYYLSIALLSSYILVVTVFYGFSTLPPLPRFPVSLAAIIPFLYSSRWLLEDVQGTESLSACERHKQVQKLGFSYGYGLFTGIDGHWHFGIEREPIMGSARLNRSLIRIFVDWLLAKVTT
ncbi:hypothetical protein ABW20_dc0105481 [Dactylellina cionopaga]|nr:hypothetical protein ABW20_dc0105481 [Dactylellina cionopaga]